MGTPLVSHVIIAYQQERYIEEAVLSAAEQDLDALEVIVADDGSSDGTPRLVEALARRFPGRVIPLVGGPNLGITGNSNRGLRAARGEFVSFQGGDDVLLPGKFSRQVRWFEQHPRAALCGHHVETFFDGGARPPVVNPPATTEGTGAAWFIENGPPFAATSVMVRRSRVPAYGFDERLPMVSDWKLSIDVLADGAEFGFVPEVLARYRVHAENVSVKRRDRMDQDSFYTLTLVDLEHPGYAESTRRGRAMLNRKRASAAWAAGDYEHARRWFAEGFAQEPRLRDVARLLAAALPVPAIEALKALRARRRSP